MDNEEKNIYLLDGHALCYRAFYAIQNLSTSKGLPTNAIYGFINILRKLLKDYNPKMMTVVFDTPVPTARHKKYEDYKIHRRPMPDELRGQIPRIKEVLSAYRISMAELAGYEADDIIATLAMKARQKGMNVTIVTTDKDALQLVNENIKVLSHHKTEDKIYDSESVFKKYGVYPENMVDFMALTGDASDNIPGVKGVGPLGAAKLISEYKSIRNMYENIDSIKSGSLKEKLLKEKDMAELSRELVDLDKNVPVIQFDFDKTCIGDPDLKRLAELFKEFEFGHLLREIIPQEIDASRYFTRNNESDVETLVQKIIRARRVSFFVVKECRGEIEGVAVSYKSGEAYFVPLGDIKEQGKPLFVRDVLENEAVEKVTYDFKNVLAVLNSQRINIKGNVFDVMIGDYLIDPSRLKVDLESIAMRELAYNLVHKQEETDLNLACEKSDIIMRLYELEISELKEKSLISLFRNVEMPLVWVLSDMEKEGVKIDTVYLQEQSIVVGNEIEELTKRIYELAGGEFNVNSPKQLQEILYEKLKLPVSKKIKTGFSTDESVLRKLSERHELPKILLEYREMNKLKTAYYDSIQQLVDKQTGKLHTKFNQAVTATGRLSSSEPNIQNIPIKTERARTIRRAFIADKDEDFLVSADYSQIELRILAHLSKDENLIKAFQKGQDVHCFTASLIFGCEVSDVTKLMRNAAKTVNFGIIYGISAFGLAKDLAMSVEEAEKFITAYFERYSGVKSFIDRTIKEARENGFVTTLLKRRRYIPEITSSNMRIRNFAERAAVNTPVQGTAADVIKLAMIKCHNEFKNTPVKMIMQVHDELVFNVPEVLLKPAARKIKEIMENIIKLEVPLKVNVDEGKNWLDMKMIEM
ncbi:MAG: DNA polymerase I [Candidatus Omnitrophota bacterium]